MPLSNEEIISGLIHSSANCRDEIKIPVNYHDDQMQSWYECSNCHQMVNRLQKYCGECGSRLSWDMETMGRC